MFAFAFVFVCVCVCICGCICVCICIFARQHLCELSISIHHYFHLRQKTLICNCKLKFSTTIAAITPPRPILDCFSTHFLTRVYIHRNIPHHHSEPKSMAFNTFWFVLKSSNWLTFLCCWKAAEKWGNIGLVHYRLVHNWRWKYWEIWGEIWREIFGEIWNEYWSNIGRATALKLERPRNFGQLPSSSWSAADPLL